MSSESTAAEAPVAVYRTYDDGYIVRSMTPTDAKIVQRWYSGMGVAARYDLDIALTSFPASMRGFYIGELSGQVVASAVRLPWGPDVCYGSYYYVEKAYRGTGYGTRLRDQVAFEHVAGRKLCVDAVLGKVADTNREKFGYHDVFRTGRFITTAKQSYNSNSDAKIVSASEVEFSSLIDYDNKCFISQNFGPRREFLRQWIQIPLGATYVAMRDGHVVGYGCRRPTMQAGNHQVGPLYGDNSDVAEALLARLCSDVTGDKVTINIWYKNTAAVELLKKFEFSNVFDLLRMHANGDIDEYKDQAFAVTCIDLCGF